MAINLANLLQEMIDHKASDLFLKAGTPPSLRVDGLVVPLDYASVTVRDTEDIAEDLMSDVQNESFRKAPEMDLAIGMPGVGRFRVNVFRQRGSVGMVFRHVDNPTFSFEDLNLPPAVRTLSEVPRGLVLVTGTTGSGKSTTLAAVINHINSLRKCHIVTVEDPIEFLHADNVAIISQREVGFDTPSFHEALKHVLRQSPDVILIGEMRDLETMSTALAAAETGHLVLSTLHTTDAVQTVERIIHYFPAYLHGQVRMQLSLCLRGVICQRLLPLASGRGRIPAVEVLINTPTVKKILSEGRTLEIHDVIVSGGHAGMQTFDQSLKQLYERKLIKLEEAFSHATSPDEIRLAVEGVRTGVKFAELHDSE